VAEPWDGIREISKETKNKKEENYSFLLAYFTPWSLKPIKIEAIKPSRRQVPS
jgi:hypothetical protein